MSHWESAGRSDEWYTPAYIFDALCCRFDMDVAAPPCGPLHVPCDSWIFANSLTEEWHGFVWMNPPFGPRNGIAPWLDKFFRHGSGIALVPDRTSAPWFQAYAPKASAILFVAPKVKFIGFGGKPGKSPSTGTVLLAAGDSARQALIHGRALGFLVSAQ